MVKIEMGNNQHLIAFKFSLMFLSKHDVYVKVKYLVTVIHLIKKTSCFPISCPSVTIFAYYFLILRCNTDIYPLSCVLQE